MSLVLVARGHVSVVPPMTGGRPDDDPWSRDHPPRGHAVTRSARLAAGLAIVATIALGACGSASTPAPASAPAPTAAASTGVVAATDAPAAETTPAEATAPALEATPVAASDDRPLEDRLPTTYGGVTLEKLSLSGEGAIDTSALPLLAKYGKSAADVSAATAYGDTDVIFIALRVKGASEDAMRELMVASAGQGSGDVQVEEVTVGGQAVYKTTVPGSESHGYFAIRGDTAFGVTAATDDVAARALAALP
jgi:hypothetical protein